MSTAAPRHDREHGVPAPRLSHRRCGVLGCVPWRAALAEGVDAVPAWRRVGWIRFWPRSGRGRGVGLVSGWSASMVRVDRARACLRAVWSPAAALPSDDFLSWSDFGGWWPRFDRQVLMPLLSGCDAHYQVRDWANDEFGSSLGGWKTVRWSPLVFLEGVSCTRRAVADRLTYRTWVQAPESCGWPAGWTATGRAIANCGWTGWRPSAGSSPRTAPAPGPTYRSTGIRATHTIRCQKWYCSTEASAAGNGWPHPARQDRIAARPARADGSVADHGRPIAVSDAGTLRARRASSAASDRTTLLPVTLEPASLSPSWDWWRIRAPPECRRPGNGLGRRSTVPEHAEQRVAQGGTRCPRTTRPGSSRRILHCPKCCRRALTGA